MDLDQIMVCADAQARKNNKPRFVYWYTPWQRWVNSPTWPISGTNFVWFFEPFKEPRQVELSELAKDKERYGPSEFEKQLQEDEERRKARRLDKIRRKENQKYNAKSNADRPKVV